MTTLEPVVARDGDEPVSEPADRRWWSRAEQVLGRFSEWLNPILVKETRQALKSRQFGITFALVLACGWVWSMLGVALIGPGIFYGAQGVWLFAGYYVVLSFPLLVIVPFGAFRSLAGEREDGTYEMLSVTTLKPRQIVSGKLGSAVLQMLVYFSGIAPCLAFTYMLEGIDMPTILFMLFYTFLGSLGLSLAGLLIATVTAEKHWQVVLSVFLIFGLGLAFWGSCALVFEMVGWNSLPFQDEEFWIGNAAFLTGYWGYFALLAAAASAQLTFASDNRSTALRMVMVAQQVLFAGWMGWAWLKYGEMEFLLVFLMMSGLHWYAMGVFMNSESGELSQRVRRQLPQSFLGRAFLTWFAPGPATGFMFAFANLISVALMTLIGVLIWLMFNPMPTPSWSGAMTLERLLTFGGLGLGYVTVYLGLGRLLLSGLRRFIQVPMLLGVLVQVLLLLAGCFIPLTIHLMIPDLRRGYSLLEITNPIWTLGYATFESIVPDELFILWCAVPLAGVVIFLANVPAVVTAVRHVRIAKPRRVAEEDLLIEAQRSPPTPEPVNPLD
ncbi:MAG: hypothetical protein WD847_17800 [Pirellulales bacterium]